MRCACGLQHEFDNEGRALSLQREGLARSAQQLFICGISLEEILGDSIARPELYCVNVILVSALPFSLHIILRPQTRSAGSVYLRSPSHPPSPSPSNVSYFFMSKLVDMSILLYPARPPLLGWSLVPAPSLYFACLLRLSPDDFHLVAISELFIVPSEGNSSLVMGVGRQCSEVMKTRLKYCAWADSLGGNSRPVRSSANEKTGKD